MCIDQKMALGGVHRELGAEMRIGDCRTHEVPSSSCLLSGSDYYAMHPHPPTTPSLRCTHLTNGVLRNEVQTPQELVYPSILMHARQSSQRTLSPFPAHQLDHGASQRAHIRLPNIVFIPKFRELYFL